MQAPRPAPGVQTKLAMVGPHGYLGGQPCYGDLAKRLDARLRRSSQISAGAGEAEAVGSFLGGEHGTNVEEKGESPLGNRSTRGLAG